MVEIIKSKITTLGANVKDQELIIIEPAEGETITILEQAFSLVADGKLEGYLSETKVDEIIGDFIADEDNPIPISRELKPGEKYVLKATSVTGGDFKYYFKYDWVKA